MIYNCLEFGILFIIRCVAKRIKRIKIIKYIYIYKIYIYKRQHNATYIKYKIIRYN